MNNTMGEHLKNNHYSVWNSSLSHAKNDEQRITWPSPDTPCLVFAVAWAFNFYSRLGPTSWRHGRLSC